MKLTGDIRVRTEIIRPDGRSTAFAKCLKEGSKEQAIADTLEKQAETLIERLREEKILTA